jgi:hypothetical protein
MPAIDFPNTPSVNDTFTSGNTTWQYNGVSWSLVQSSQSIATGSVTTDKLATGAVTVDKLGSGSVTIDKIYADVWASDQVIISNQLFS